jgi:hypothetical protein
VVQVPDPSDRLTLEEAAAIVGKSVKSVRRWARTGITVNGRTLRLGSIKVGSSRLTSRTGLEAFLAAQNPPDPNTATPIPTPAQRARAVEAAGRELARILRG